MTRKVGASEQKTILKLTAAYKRFCAQRQQLTALELQIQNRLEDYEKALIRESRKILGLLPSRQPLSVKKRPPLQTGRTRQK